MIRSFRLRMALLSALLSGLALTAFGLSTWWLIRNIKLDRIDAEVRSDAEREAQRTRDPEDWLRTEAKIASSVGVRNNDELLLLVQDEEGKDNYRSIRWPAGLDSTRLPWPKRRVAQGNPSSPSRPELMPPGPPPASLTGSQKVDGRLWRIGLATTEHSRVAVAVDGASIDADMNGVRNAFLVALPLALILIGVGGWFFSGRALRPIEKLAVATRRVTAQGLDQRIPCDGEDREFVELIEVFNGMLERLERSFKQARRFSADAAHELKTPLAILQGQLERAINGAEEGSPTQAELTSILDEVRRLSTISRKLLLLSQADAGRLNIHRESFDLSKALSDLVEDTRMLAPHLTVTSDIDPALMITADETLLLQLFHNLISNAIKYNVEQGWIRVAAALRPNGLEVVVANSSHGIPTAERDKIFERFYRADPSHSRRVEGVGLGLSVSREIARAHGGDINLTTNSDGSVQFSLLLPPVTPISIPTSAGVP